MLQAQCLIHVGGDAVHVSYIPYKSAEVWQAKLYTKVQKEIHADSFNYNNTGLKNIQHYWKKGENTYKRLFLIFSLCSSLSMAIIAKLIKAWF